MIPQDKIKHFAVCVILSLISPMLAVGASLGKEYGDKGAIGNHWCWWDLLADLIGIIVGGAIHLLIFGTIYCF